MRYFTNRLMEYIQKIVQDLVYNLQVYSYFYQHYFFFDKTEALSEAVKLLKADYLVKAINKHKMDQAIIFCRTKLDCDNIENYLLTLGGVVYYINSTH